MYLIALQRRVYWMFLSWVLLLCIVMSGCTRTSAPVPTAVPVEQLIDATVWGLVTTFRQHHSGADGALLMWSTALSNVTLAQLNASDVAMVLQASLASGDPDPELMGYLVALSGAVAVGLNYAVYQVSEQPTPEQVLRYVHLVGASLQRATAISLF